MSTMPSIPRNLRAPVDYLGPPRHLGQQGDYLVDGDGVIWFFMDGKWHPTNAPRKVWAIKGAKPPGDEVYTVYSRREDAEAVVRRFPDTYKAVAVWMDAPEFIATEDPDDLPQCEYETIEGRDL